MFVALCPPLLAVHSSEGPSRLHPLARPKKYLRITAPHWKTYKKQISYDQACPVKAPRSTVTVHAISRKTKILRRILAGD